jgi:predicted nucleic acid-binding protein
MPADPTPPNDPALLDTNVLVYSVYQDAQQHAASRALVERAADPNAGLYVTAQSMAEFFATVTNHRRVTNPRTPAEALDAIERFLALPGLALLAQPAEVVSRWIELIRQHRVTGADVFDVQIVATMLASDVRRIYTFNGADFDWLPQIQVLIP